MKPQLYYSQERRPEVNITQTPQGVYIFRCVGGGSSYNVSEGQTASKVELKEKISRFIKHEPKKNPIYRSLPATNNFPISIEKPIERLYVQ